MPASTMRRGIWALALLAGLVLVLVITVPYIASTRIVRDRIAQEIGAWSGYRVEIGAPPRIDVWPRFRAVLHDVSFSDASAAGGRPIGTAERMDIELSAMAAMRGDAVFTSARLVRPTLLVRADAEQGLLPTLLGKGRLRTAIDRARAIVAGARDKATSANLPADSFGSVRIEDGKILLDGDGADDPPLVTGIAASIDWPALNSTGSVSANGIWRGEPVRLEIESADPLRLFAGAAAPLRLAVEAAPGTASFTGTATLSATPFVDGRTTLTTPSFDRLVRWTGIDLPGTARLQAVTLSGTVSGDARHLKLDGAALQVNGSKADGAIELVLGPGKASVSGSLAFDTLPLDGLFETLPMLASDRESPAVSARDGLPPLQLDLRLSAAHASAGGLDMADMAATVEIRDRSASFDLLDATALGGDWRADIRFDRNADGTATAIKLSGSGIDGGALGAAAGMTRLAPTASGSLALDVKGRGTTMRSVMENGDGGFSARFGAGTLSELDLATFLELCRQGGFFPLDEAGGGSLGIDGLDVKATITDGVAEIGRTEARFGERRIWLSGLASYADRSLALTGGVGPLEAANGSSVRPQDEARFFVGGSWSAPFISPLKAGEGGN
jgi:AsmA protein